MNNSLITLIVPTINRSEHIENLLRSIINTGEKEIEIIVVDQNMDGLIDAVMELYSKVLPINHLKVNFTGLSRARNYGIDFAKGEYIMFPDDDCEFFKNTFLKIRKELDREDIDVFCGKTVDRELRDTVCKWKRSSGFIGLKRIDGMYVEASMIIKRIIISSHRFDETLGAGCFHGSGEGYDLVLRLLEAGIRMYYTPEIMLYHPMKVTTYSSQNEIRRSFNYSTGFACMCKKHNLTQKYYIRFIKVLLYIPFCLIFRRFKLKFYLAELSGLIAGRVV